MDVRPPDHCGRLERADKTRRGKQPGPRSRRCPSAAPSPVCRYRSPFVLTIQAVSSLSATNTAWGRASYQCRFPRMVTFPQAKARLDFCSIFQRRAPVEIEILVTIQKISGILRKKLHSGCHRRQVPNTPPCFGPSGEEPAAPRPEALAATCPSAVRLQVPCCPRPHL